MQSSGLKAQWFRPGRATTGKTVYLMFANRRNELIKFVGRHHKSVCRNSIRLLARKYGFVEWSKKNSAQRPLVLRFQPSIKLMSLSDRSPISIFSATMPSFADRLCRAFKPRKLRLVVGLGHHAGNNSLNRSSVLSAR